MPRTFIGCDLSQDRLDLYDASARRDHVVPNTVEAIAAFVEGLPAEALVVFEATSGCDTLLIAALAAAGRPFVRVNPRQAREFARASGVLAKTDRVDARVLAEMAQRLDLPPSRPPEAARQRLQALILRRRQLVDVRKAEGQHLRTAADAMVAAGIRSLAGVL